MSVPLEIASTDRVRAIPVARSRSAAAVDDGFGSGTTVLLVATCWWPSVARLAHLLGLAGLRVCLLCPPGHPGSAVPGVTTVRQRALRPMRALSDAILACAPAMVLPTDDRAVAHLHRLHRIGSAAERALIERSVGAPQSYPAVTSRTLLLDLARQQDIGVPKGQPIVLDSDLDEWLAVTPGPWVLKVDGAWSGAGVRIARTPREARAALRRLRRWRGLRVAVKRMVVNRDRFWASDWAYGRAPGISVQAHVNGRPGNLAMFCQDGEVLAATVAEALACWEETGPSTIVRLVERPEFVAGAARLVRALRLTGFVGMDFMVDEATGRALLIELNPRATTLCNIRLEPGRDPIGAAVTALTGRGCAPPTLIPAGDLLAHFPLAWHWNRDDQRLAACFQDVPWDEPALMAEMLRPSWPDRPLLARLAAGSSRLIRRLKGSPVASPDARMPD